MPAERQSDFLLIYYNWQNAIEYWLVQLALNLSEILQKVVLCYAQRSLNWLSIKWLQNIRKKSN